MARTLSHEITEMTRHLTADLVVYKKLRLLTICMEHRVEILAVLLDLKEPCHVVDTRSHKIDLLFLHACVACNEIECGLHTVAESHEGYIARQGHADACRSHGIDVVH